jgi:hypothetical protein
LPFGWNHQEDEILVKGIANKKIKTLQLHGKIP